jgi:nitrate/TMAO reductase-like tetraheme cytochrome c subunit
MRNPAGAVRFSVLNILLLIVANIVFVSVLFSHNIFAQETDAQELEMDMDLMQTIESTNDNLSSNIALENAESAIADAQTLNELFAVVADHYQQELAAGKDVAEAVDLTNKSLKFSSEIITFLQQEDYESAANRATDLARTCKTCHNFYKED